MKTFTKLVAGALVALGLSPALGGALPQHGSASAAFNLAPGLSPFAKDNEGNEEGDEDEGDNGVTDPTPQDDGSAGVEDPN